MEKLYYIEIINLDCNQTFSHIESGILIKDPLFTIFKSNESNDCELFNNFKDFKNSIVYSKNDFSKYVKLIRLK